MTCLMQIQNPEELWRNSHGRQGRGLGGPGDSDSAGEVCASILVKLIIDMYLKAGPAVAYPLALLMMQRQGSTQPAATAVAASAYAADAAVCMVPVGCGFNLMRAAKQLDHQQQVFRRNF